MTLPLLQILRAWLQVDTVTLPDCTSSVEEFPSNTLQLHFTAPSPILEAVSFGRKFTIAPQELFTILEITPASATGIARDRLKQAAGYVIQEQDPETSRAIASVGSRTLKLVKTKQITGDNQIAILEGGRVENSENLIGSPISIHCPILYPAVARMSEESLDEFTVNLIGKGESGWSHFSLLRCKLAEGRLPRSAEWITLKIIYSLDDIKVRSLQTID